MKRIIEWLIVGIVSIGLTSSILSSLFSDQPFISLIGLLKYFTIWSNIFVLLLFVNKLRNKTKFLKPIVGSIYINIILTMVGYIILLSRIYQPAGFDMVSNLMHHYFSPIFVIIYLILFESKRFFKKEYLFSWYIFPTNYLGFALLYSAFADKAIYPFLDFQLVGPFFVILITLFISISYFLLAILLIKLNSKKAV